MSDTGKDCGNCRWWQEQSALQGGQLGGEKQGECHRNPPTAVVVGQGALGGAFPPTKASNWCGAWEPWAVPAEPEPFLPKVKATEHEERLRTAVAQGMKFVVVDDSVPMTSPDWVRATFRTEAAAAAYVEGFSRDSAYDILPMEKVVKMTQDAEEEGGEGDGEGD